MFLVRVDVLDISMLCNFISLYCVSSFRSKGNIGPVEKIWEYSLLFYCLKDYVFWNWIFGITHMSNIPVLCFPVEVKLITHLIFFMVIGQFVFSAFF